MSTVQVITGLTAKGETGGHTPSYVYGRPELRLWITGIAMAMAVLMFLKFLVVKPIAFLALAILFGLGAFLFQRRSSAGQVLLLVLMAVAAVLFGAHLFDKGFDADQYQNNTDYIVILLGFPIAVIGLIAVATTFRNPRPTSRTAP